MPLTTHLPLAILISGTGRSLHNLIKRRAAGQLPIDIRLVVSSHPQAPGLQLAQDVAIPTEIIPRESAASPEAFRDAIFGACRNAQAELVVMAGFIKHVLIPNDFAGRVINIHPALIPAFCGQGFYGMRVHRAVLEHGVRVTGCTVHFVDNQYDHGPIILQRMVPVLDDDTPESLAARVFAEECEALPEAIRRLANGTLKPAGGEP